MVAASSLAAATPLAGMSVSSSPRHTACRPFRHVLPQPIGRRTPIATYSVRSMLVRRCGRNACSSIRAPIIAVLAQPDNQELGERADAYNRLIKDMAVLPVAAAPAQGRTGAGYVLTLGGMEAGQARPLWPHSRLCARALYRPRHVGFAHRVGAGAAIGVPRPAAKDR